MKPSGPHQRAAPAEAKGRCFTFDYGADGFGRGEGVVSLYVLGSVWGVGGRISCRKSTKCLKGVGINLMRWVQNETDLFCSCFGRVSAV